MAKHSKRPRDTNQLAKCIVDLATMDESERSAVKMPGKKEKVAKVASKTQSPGKSGSSSV